VDKFITDKQLPHPSFDAKAPVELGLPPDIERARCAVLQATQELNDLLQKPRDILLNHHVHPLELLTRVTCLTHVIAQYSRPSARDLPFFTCAQGSYRQRYIFL
jgi:hypothetical protein